MTRTSAARDEDDEAGFVGGFEGLLFGLLDTKFAVDAAAREAVRAYVEAPDAGSAGQQSQEAALETLAGYGRPRPGATIRLIGGGFGRCERVTIEVAERSPMIVLPWIGRVGSGGRVSAEHSELVDPFRAGLPGTSTCA
jgi:hypothetical protein